MAKNFTDYLTPDDIIELTGESRAKIFTELVSLTAEKRGVEPEDVFSAIMAREKIMSTAIGEGVAIPHGRMADLGEPLVILVLVDWNDSDIHLELLSSIAKVFLKTPGIFDNISKCSSKADFLAELKKLV